MSQDSTSKTIAVALAVTIISSILVSTAVVTLRPLQAVNSALDKRRNILLAIGIDVHGEEINREFSKIKSEVIDLTTGEISSRYKPENYDLAKILKSPDTSIKLSKEEDIAGVHFAPRFQLAYIVEEDEKVKYVILPIYGKGLWSTIYGFLALENDMDTVKGITFYEHGETPGLGGEIENPKWQAIWPGKQIYGDENEVKIEVIKGIVNENTPDKIYKVDGLSGSTLTSRGVSQTMRFWAGERGFAKFLANIKKSQSEKTK